MLHDMLLLTRPGPDSAAHNATCVASRAVIGKNTSSGVALAILGLLAKPFQ